MDLEKIMKNMIRNFTSKDSYFRVLERNEATICKHNFSIELPLLYLIVLNVYNRLFFANNFICEKDI